MFQKSVSGLQAIKATSVEVSTKSKAINIDEDGISIPVLDHVHGGKMPIKFGDTAFHVGHLSDDPEGDYLYLKDLFAKNQDNNDPANINNVTISVDRPVGEEARGRYLSAKIDGDLDLDNAAVIKIGGSQINSADLSNDADLLKNNISGQILTGDLQITDKLTVDNNIVTKEQYQVSQNGQIRQIKTDELSDKLEIIFKGAALTNDKLVKSKITNGKVELDDKELEKSDLAGITDLVYKDPSSFTTEQIVKSDAEGRLITGTISSDDLTDKLNVIYKGTLTNDKLVKSKITDGKVELEDKDLEKSDLDGITDLVFKKLDETDENGNTVTFFNNDEIVKSDQDGTLITGTLSSEDLTDNSSLVKTDDARLINLSASTTANNDKIVTVDNGQIVYKTLSFVNDTQTFNFPTDEDGNLVLPEGGITITGQHAQITASPAALCLFNSQGEIDAYTLTDNKFLESIMGYSSADKTDTYGQGLVPRGHSNHNNEFLRKDGSWGLPSVHTGSVSDNLRSLNDFPNDYTGHHGKYLKIDNDASYPSGTGVVFTSINDDIQDYINSGDLTGLSINGIVQAQSFLSVSDKRLKKDIKKLHSEESLDLLKKIEPVTYQFKNDKENRTKVGVLAQQIQRVMPDSVIDCGGTLKVEMLDLLGVLLGAVKGLTDEIDSLKKQIY